MDAIAAIIAFLLTVTPKVETWYDFENKVVWLQVGKTHDFCEYRLLVKKGEEWVDALPPIKGNNDYRYAYMWPDQSSEIFRVSWRLVQE